MLLEDRRLAIAANQLAVARAATESLGRLHGLYTEKRQDQVTLKDVTDEPMTAEEWKKQCCGGTGKH